MSNIITATFCNNQVETTTESAWQYDYGQELHIEGLDLPSSFETHFSNTQIGDSISALGADGVVSIPDTYLRTGQPVYCYIYLHTGDDDGETEYMITIPVIRRASISDETPTPAEQTIIEQAIEALNAGVAAAEAAAAEIRNMNAEAETLPAGSSATASWDDGTLSLGIPTGPQGEAGYTPVRGVDYWTTSDQDTIVEDVLERQEIGGDDVILVYDENGTFITIDSALSSTSENPVQNKVIYTALEGKAGTSVATTSAAGLMSATDKTRLDVLYADYSSALAALGVS